MAVVRGDGMFGRRRVVVVRSKGREEKRSTYLPTAQFAV